MRPRVLMCRPTHFEVRYSINPWMKPGTADRELAERQWLQLRERISAVASVTEIEPAAGLPDMVFTANAAAVFGKKAVASRFGPVERRGEEVHFCKWLYHAGYVMAELPARVAFEGAGDCLFDVRRDVLWMGHGQRSAVEAIRHVSDTFSREALALRLVDPRFYHLDTCLCPLEGGQILFYPLAFDEASQELLYRRTKPSERITVSETDATNFACNLVNIRGHVFVHRPSQALSDALAERDYRVIPVDLSEFIKAGGSAKCLTLSLDQG